MLAGIREILIISTPTDIHLYEELFDSGKQLGLDISYKVQPSPDGLSQAFILGEEFIGDDSVCLILGDNIFYGYNFRGILEDAARLQDGAIVFGYYVLDERSSALKRNPRYPDQIMRSPDYIFIPMTWWPRQSR